jgi:hypothetical protein
VFAFAASFSAVKEHCIRTHADSVGSYQVFIQFNSLHDNLPTRQFIIIIIIII